MGGKDIGQLENAVEGSSRGRTIKYSLNFTLSRVLLTLARIVSVDWWEGRSGCGGRE